MASKRSLILATPEGIGRLPIRPDGSPGPLEQALKEEALEAVCQDAAGTLFAGSDGGKIYRSENRGRDWNKVSEGFPKSRGLWTLTAHPLRAGELYAGLEPVSLWVSRDGGRTWEELEALRRHPSAKRWHFYEPSKPHIRAVSFDARGKRLYVGIEVGGVLSSRDGGKSFEDVSRGADEDVHGIQVAADDEDLLFAMTGDGLYRSPDGGKNWKKLGRGLGGWYLVPLAFAGGDPNFPCAGAGNAPPPWQDRSAEAAIYLSRDGGKTWTGAEGPFPLRGMLSAILPDAEDPSRLFAATTDGTLLVSRDGAAHWHIAVRDLPRVEEMVLTIE